MGVILLQDNKIAIGESEETNDKFSFRPSNVLATAFYRASEELLFCWSDISSFSIHHLADDINRTGKGANWTHLGRTIKGRAEGVNLINGFLMNFTQFSHFGAN